MFLAARKAALRARDWLKEAYGALGDRHQRRYALREFLADPSLRREVQSVLGYYSEDAVVGQHLVQSIRKLFQHMFKDCKKNFRLTKKQRAFVGFISTCAEFGDQPGSSRHLIEKCLGLSNGTTYRNFSKGNKRAMLIQAGDSKGYEMKEEDAKRSKFTEDQLQ